MVNQAGPTSGLSAIVCHGWPLGVNVATLLVPCCHTPTNLFAHDDGSAATAFPATKIIAEAPSARDQNILALFVINKQGQYCCTRSADGSRRQAIALRFFAFAPQYRCLLKA